MHSLLAQGWHVIGISRKPAINQPEFQHLALDLGDSGLLERGAGRSCLRVDALIHAAGILKKSAIIMQLTPPMVS
ncbi:MAG: hypothetical protein R3E95_03145 [Thiolinea sp.]